MDFTMEYLLRSVVGSIILGCWVGCLGKNIIEILQLNTLSELYQ